MDKKQHRKRKNSGRCRGHGTARAVNNPPQAMGAYILERIDKGQTEKDVCTYCNQRMGFDYEVIPKTDGRE